MSLKTVDPQTLKNWIAEDKAVLVDVREAGEVARERIPVAHHMPLSQFHGRVHRDFRLVHRDQIWK